MNVAGSPERSGAGQAFQALPRRRRNQLRAQRRTGRSGIALGPVGLYDSHEFVEHPLQLAAHHPGGGVLSKTQAATPDPSMRPEVRVSRVPVSVGSSR